MGKHGYSDKKNKVIHRINRIEGQVRGISRMVEEDKYCIDILTQITAIQSALDKVAIELLRDHAKHCLATTEKDSKDHDEKTEELVNAISRML